VARQAEDGRDAQGPVEGPVPLTPVQRAFFEQALPHPGHFNQALLLVLKQPLSPERVEQALLTLVAHHDALRLRFTRGDDGAWTQVNAGLGAPPRLRRFDFAHVPPEALASTL